MVRSRFLFLRYLINSFVLPNPTGGSLKTFLSCAISIFILATRISGMPNSFACHQFKVVKDEHNIILILDSPKWLILYSGGSSNSRFEMLYLFFSRSSKFSAIYRREDPSKSSQGFTLCFQLLFPFVRSSFYYRSSHEGSTWWFIKDLIPFGSVH